MLDLRFGELVGERKYIGRKGKLLIVQCPVCFRRAYGFYSQLKKAGCVCQKSQRFSGETYENSPEKIMNLKNKYKNGIPDGLIDNWIMGL